MPAALSPENRIGSALRALECSGRNFVALARMLGASISDTKLSLAMNDTKPLDRETADKLLDVTDRMRELQSAIYTATDANGVRLGFVQVDWGRTTQVADACTNRLMSMVGRDMGDPDQAQLQTAADSATRATVSK